ncbi:MAG: L-rhamnose isomerase [Candidatus Methylacidiphilales bacterium]
MISYAAAQEEFARHQIDTEAALARLEQLAVSLHCWQGDDVGGFEKVEATRAGGGTLVTGNYPGRARTIEELQADLDQVLKLVPGRKRLNLHACYGDFRSRKVDRDGITVEHFEGWIEWCRSRGMGLDFNPTFFAHPRAESGFTLSHADPAIREFWIAHGIACRKVAAEAGRRLGSPVITNFWIPDGYKDLPADRFSPRQRLEESLDRIFDETLDPVLTRDAVESKLFGIGSESYVVGSHEFYLGYAVKRQKIYCLDMGHFHPTESVADKISSILLFVPELLFHVSRGVRWDSDHVVLWDDPTRAVAEELVRGNCLERTHVGLDFFDASINRIAAWTLGTRNVQKAFLSALLLPNEQLRQLEAEGDFTARLALMEDAKTLPMGAVWAEWCRRHGVPGDGEWLGEVKAYELSVLRNRS